MPRNYSAPIMTGTAQMSSFSQGRARRRARPRQALIALEALRSCREPGFGTSRANCRTLIE